MLQRGLQFAVSARFFSHIMKAAKNSIVPVPCVAQTAKHTLDVGDGAIVPNANAADTDRDSARQRFLISRLKPDKNVARVSLEFHNKSRKVSRS